jgi:probable HAF family extracellular repeat protein
MIAYKYFIVSIACMNIGMLGAVKAPEMTDLGLGTEIYAINEKGQIAFTATVSNTVDHQAVLWEKGVRTHLGFLPGDTESWTADLNKRGQVVGWSTGTCYSRAFVWQGGVMTPLAGCGTQARSINDRGQIVGWSHDQGAVMWQDGRMIDLGLPGANARAINEHGQIVGQYYPNGDSRAFLWENGRVTDLGLLPGTQYCWPNSINNHGQVVGSCLLSSGGFGFRRAFLWDKGIMTELDRPAGIVGSNAGHISDRGEIVGDIYGLDFQSRAAMWNNGTLIELTAAIAPSLWRLQSAYDINDRGQVVGSGYLLPADYSHSYLLEIR